jgi:hypothetical protein
VLVIRLMVDAKATLPSGRYYLPSQVDKLYQSG